MHTPNENDKKILVDDGITTYPHRTNIPFIKDFVFNYIEELKKIYKEFIEKKFFFSIRVFFHGH